MEMLQIKLHELTPTNELQRQMFQQAQQTCTELRQTRSLVIEQAKNVLPTPFLVMLLLWLTALHMSFGLFAPRNAMVLVVLLICALSVSGAIFLILEMNHPLSGVIKVSNAPMLKVLEQLGQ
jgi:membrane-bound ClpP family serine protease